MINQLFLMQKICLDIKRANVCHPKDGDPWHDDFLFFHAVEDEDGTCPANDKCPLYQFCAAGRSYGVVEGGYEPTHVKLLESPNIIPWTAEQMGEMAAIVNDYQFIDTIDVLPPQDDDGVNPRFRNSRHWNPIV